MNLLKTGCRRGACVLLAVSVLVGCVGPLEAAPRTVRLLTVGNSFADNALTFLPKLAEAAGHRLVVGRANLGGCSLDRHWRHVAAHVSDREDPEGRPYGGGRHSLEELLKREAWDYVTLQQVSYRSHDRETYHPYIDRLHDYVRQRAPRAEILLHQIWAYRVDDPRFVPSNEGREPHTRELMYRQVRDTYHAVATQLGLRLIPSGDAMFQADSDEKWGFKPVPGVDPKIFTYPALPEQTHSLHVGWTWRKEKDGRRILRMDGHHAGEAGKYLLGCVWFEFLFGEDVSRNGFVPEDIDPEYASFLRTTAHRVIAALEKEAR